MLSRNYPRPETPYITVSLTNDYFMPQPLKFLNFLARDLFKKTYEENPA